MAPKVHKYAREAAASEKPQWKYRNDVKSSELDPAAWTSYRADQNEKIEAAYQSGCKITEIGDYYVDTKAMTQMKKTDPSKWRRVRRFLCSTKTERDKATLPPSIAGTAAAAAPAVAITIVSSTSSLTEEPMPKKAKREGPAAVSNGSSTQDVVVLTKVAEPTPPLARKDESSKTLRSPSTIPPPPSASAVTAAATATPVERVVSKGVVFVTRADAAVQPVVFLPKTVDSATIAVINDVFAHVPSINRSPLDAASKLISPTRRWLQFLGRLETETGVFITLPRSLDALDDHKRIPLSEAAVATGAQVKSLCKSAMITYVGKKPLRILLPNEDSSKQSSLSAADHLKTQQLVVSGLVQLLYDGHYRAIAKPPTVVMCSTPGINFAYSAIDRSYFTRLESDDSDDGGGGRSSKKTVLDKEKILTRMRLIWQHILLVMDEKFHVQYAVLCAIGCGAFKGVFGSQIPLLWGKALAQVACNSAKVLKHLTTIFVSLPTFGKDNNFAPFQHAALEVLKEHGDVAFPPLVFMEDASMTDIAARLCSSGGSDRVVGILNPSDVQAIRHGWMGMYWDGGHIALEEVLAMQTTLLLQHVGLNRSLFTDPARWVPMKKILPDMDES